MVHDKKIDTEFNILYSELEDLKLEQPLFKRLFYT